MHKRRVHRGSLPSGRSNPDADSDVCGCIDANTDGERYNPDTYGNGRNTNLNGDRRDPNVDGYGRCLPDR